MTGNWEDELKKLKQEFNKETTKTKRKAKSSSDSSERKLRKLLKSLLLPVVGVFNEEGLTKTLQPHLHQHKNGYTLVVPVTESSDKPIFPRLEMELLLVEKGCVLKVVKDTPKGPATEKIIQQPITEEIIRQEIRTFLSDRQNLILNIKKRSK